MSYEASARPVAVQAKRGPNRMHAMATAAALAVAGVSYFFFDYEQRIVALPLYAIIATTAVMLAMLWQRDGAPPYFDLGVVCVAVTFVYLAYPLGAFLLAGMEWTDLSDNRLLAHKATPVEYAQVGWWGAVYLFTLAATYLFARKSPTVGESVPLQVPSRRAIVLMAWAYAFIFIYLQVIQIVFQVDLNPTYGSNVRTVDALPLIMQQITNKLSHIGIVLQFALILLLVQHADYPMWRWTLRLWAVLQIMVVILVFGSRSSVIFFILAWLLAHQRLRHRLRPLVLLGVGLAIVAAALLYGLARDMGGRAEPGDSVFSANNEFQALYGTSFDLIRLRDTGMLSDVPWQLYFADLLRLIPQQLLPFEKVDPGDWYLGVLGIRGEGVGLMFGVTSEAALGLGIFEMILRGIAVGFIFATIHNWYTRNASRFWPTLFYLWLCVWSYYTYRASSFYLLAHVLFVFLPAYLGIKLLSGKQDFTPIAPLPGGPAHHRGGR